MAIEGYNAYIHGTFDMYLVTDLDISPKFNVPEFKKYKGLSFPRNHLVMFCQKMASYACNNKLMIHHIQS